MRGKIFLITSALALSIHSAPQAEALGFTRTPSTVWFHTYATGVQSKSYPAVTANVKANEAGKSANLETKSKFIVTYTGFPDDAKAAFQAAVDIWSDLFQSSVPIRINATWGRQATTVLGSTRPDFFYKNFVGAPARDLNYATALANALAGKDLDPARPDIIMTINSRSPFYTGTDGKPSPRTYDLESVVMHEIAHGLGFLTLASYDPFFGYGNIEDPTPFDAFTQLADGRRLMDLSTPSLELGSALTAPLYWGGANGVAANNGNKPLLYTPKIYEGGSSVSHLDEKTFSQSLTDAAMTPNLDAGEVFRSPGPITLGMLEDMRTKPGAGIPVGLPEAPRNVKAIIGDKSAIITFDPPANFRAAQVTSYQVTASFGGQSVEVTDSPALITGLKNGSTYSFKVIARNQLGDSPTEPSNAISPEAGWKTSVIDGIADGKYISTNMYKGQPIIAYTDSKNGDVKVGTFNGKTWVVSTVDGNGTLNGRTTNNVAGDVSLCVSGTGSKQILNLFYPDLVNKDLRYAEYDGKTWKYEVVDGDAPTVQNYSEKVRVRTASDVSVTNACAVTPSGLQVIYRDESQGVLLGAVRSMDSWIYELIDGDRATDGRSTGDVGFHLQAAVVGKKVYVFYDSILVVNQNSEATQGEVRLATRSTIYPEDWVYQTVAITGGPVAVSGYNVGISVVGNRVFGSWYSASGITIPHPNKINWAVISNSDPVIAASSDAYGTPIGALAIDDKDLIFGCEARLCKISKLDQSIHLVSNAKMDKKSDAVWITINKVRYALTSINAKLTLLKP